jgi:micrococcal nuclease
MPQSFKAHGGFDFRWWRLYNKSGMRKRICILLAILLLAAVVLTGCTEKDSQPDTAEVKPQQATPEPKDAGPNISGKFDRTVESVIDGYTIELNDGEKVRLIGVSCPETDEPFSKEATEFTRKTIEGKRVWLEYDKTRKDKSGRTLAYVNYWAKEDKPAKFESEVEICIASVLNEVIIRQGYGHVNTEYSFKHMEMYRKLEKEAREAKRGLWAQKKPQSIPSEEEILKQYMIPPESRGFTPLEHSKRMKHLVPVFINGTDGFYHRHNCSSLLKEEGGEAKSKVKSIYLGLASMSYKPCPQCKPPELVTVYINSKDGFYHRGDCSYLHNEESKEGKTKVRSIYLGLVSGIYKPCPHCKPPE